MISNLRENIEKDSFLNSLYNTMSKYENIVFDMFVSNACNLKCKHCYFLDYKPIEEPLTLQKWYDIIDECISLGIKHFHFSGKEPFCDKRIPLLLERLNELSNTYDLWYGLVTNGTLLTVNYLNELVNSNLSYLEFSLEGDYTYNYNIRGVKSFDKIYELVSGLSNKEKINITSTYFGDNIEELKRMVSSFYNIGIRKFNFAPYLKFESSSLQPIEEFDSSLIVDLIKCFREYLETVWEYSIDIRICMTRKQAYDLFIKHNPLTEAINNCIYDGKKIVYMIGNNILEVNYPLLYIPFLSQLIVTTDGKVISCADDIHYKNITDISLGDVKRSSMEEIINKRNEQIISYINQKI